MNEAYKPPTIEELNNPATHLAMLETGEITRYANSPVRGTYRQEIADQDKGTVTRKPVAFWYQQQGGSWLLFAQLGGRFKKTPEGAIYVNERGKREIEGDTRLNGLEAAKLWNSRLYPIDKQTWEGVLEGKPWPGVNAIAEQDRQQEGQPQGAYATYKARVDALVQEAARILEAGPAKTSADADAAGDVAGRLARLEKQGPDFAKDDPEVTKEMREVITQVRQLAGRWKATYEPIKLVVGNLKGKVITPYQVAAKAAADARRAEAQAQGGDISNETMKAAVHVAGGHRTIALREFIYVREFTDYKAALAHVQDDPEVVEAVLAACQRRARNEENPPGVQIIKEQRSV